jgi:hypothetical protein
MTAKERKKERTESNIIEVSHEGTHAQSLVNWVTLLGGVELRTIGLKMRIYRHKQGW